MATTLLRCALDVLAWLGIIERGPRMRTIVFSSEIDTLNINLYWIYGTFPTWEQATDMAAALWDSGTTKTVVVCPTFAGDEFMVKYLPAGYVNPSGAIV
jgi:hypothetical protein